MVRTRVAAASLEAGVTLAQVLRKVFASQYQSNGEAQRVAIVRALRLKFSDLFHGLEYAARCQALSGQEIEIRGWLSPAHDGSGDVMLVEHSGECPDCSPVAAISLPGFRSGAAGRGTDEVTLRGRLSYGFALQGGKGSLLRLEGARIKKSGSDPV